MAHVEDRWTVTRADGQKARTPRHGTGLRWRVRYLDPSGAERSKSFARKPDAERFMNATAAKVSDGTWIDPDAGKITLRKFADDWLAMQTFDPSTRETTGSRLRRHVYPVLGDYPLGQLASRPSLVQAWLRGLSGSESSAKLIFTTLATVLNAAVADELIPRNPCHARNVTRPKPAAHRIEPWTAERVAAVREALPERYRILCDLGSGLGLRQGEIFGLSPDDITDWLRPGKAVLHVRRQVKIVRGKLVLAPPKGGKLRDVPVPESVRLALAEHLAAFGATTVTMPWREPGGQPVTARLALSSPTGLAVNRNSFNRGPWKAALETAGVPAGRDAGTHQLRHHFASALLHDGVDIRALSEYLGHSDPGFTLRVYCHLMPNAADRMRQAIDKARGQADGPATAQGGAR
jgi:integrase